MQASIPHFYAVLFPGQASLRRESWAGPMSIDTLVDVQSGVQETITSKTCKKKRFFFF